MTVRQVYYRLVSNGIIDKTEAEYKNTVCRLLGTMRLSGEIDFSQIADSTRWMRKPQTHHGMREALEATKNCYRRMLWANQFAHVEVWLEKEALAGVLCEVTDEWDVPLMVTRGYPSLSFLHSAAQTIRHNQKPTFIYYFGDHDPSGVDISRNVEDRLWEFSDRAFEFERVAVTPEQIDEFDLPTRPTKTTDSRAKNFEGESVEVDAIPPAMLRQMCETCITQHVDEVRLAAMRETEAAERETLSKVLEAFSDAQFADYQSQFE